MLYYFIKPYDLIFQVKADTCTMYWVPIISYQAQKQIHWITIPFTPGSANHLLICPAGFVLMCMGTHWVDAHR